MIPRLWIQLKFNEPLALAARDERRESWLGMRPLEMRALHPIERRRASIVSARAGSDASRGGREPAGSRRPLESAAERRGTIVRRSECSCSAGPNSLNQKLGPFIGLLLRPAGMDARSSGPRIPKNPNPPPPLLCARWAWLASQVARSFSSARVGGGETIGSRARRFRGPGCVGARSNELANYHLEATATTKHLSFQTNRRASLAAGRCAVSQKSWK